MGAYWALLNIDKRESSGDVTGRMGETIYCMHALVHQLLVLHLPLEIPPASSLPRDDLNKDTLGQLAFPPELITMIFDDVDDVRDVASLAVTNRLLSTIGFRRMRTLLLEWEQMRWAGDRVVCVYDSSTESAPSNMLTEEEFKEFGDLVMDMYTLSSQWPRAQKQSFDLSETERAVKLLGLRWYRRSVDDLRCIELAKAALPECPLDKEWVLCNLTRREFVRTDAIAGITGSVYDGPFIRHSEVDMGTVAILMTIWWGCPTEEPGGLWAGNRIQISTLDSLPGDPEGWKDISTTVVRETEEFMDSWGLDVNNTYSYPPRFDMD